MIFETRCAGCDKLGSAPICTTCRFALLGPAPRPRPDGIVAAIPFAGRARSIVLGMKYRNRRAVARHLAGLIVNRLVEQGVGRGGADDVDVVTWAPTSARRRRERGFDQSEMIARTVARQLGRPCRRLLERSDCSSFSQTGRSRAERLTGPRMVARPDVDGLRVLVVDDVVTTGATLQACRDALVARGAETLLVAVAATPERRSAEVVTMHPRHAPAA